MRWICGVVLSCCLSTTALAWEKRCGWYQNPTPGNHWVLDRHAKWVMSSQGKDLENNFGYAERKGPDLWKTGDWVKPYPDVCGCLEGTFGEISEGDSAYTSWGTIIHIETIEHLPIERCEDDPNLFPPQR